MKIKCEHCETFLDIPEQYAGQGGKCNKCGGQIWVPLSASINEPKRRKKMSEKDKRVVAIVVPVAILLVIVGQFVESKQAQREERDRQPTGIEKQPPPQRVIQPQPQPDQQAQPVVAEPEYAPVSSLDFFTIRDKRETMTDVQWKQYARGLKGTRIKWSGWVEDSREKLLGGYEVWIDMDHPDEAFSVQDVQFAVSENIAASLSKDQFVEFTGTIDAVMGTLGTCSVVLMDGTVLP